MKTVMLWGLGLFLGTFIGLFLTAAPAAAIENRLGLGVHVWMPASELLDDSAAGDESDLAAVLSYQLVLFRLLKLEADVEFFPNGFGGSGEEAWSPQALIVVGDRWYAAIGTGLIYSQDLEGDLSDTIYIARLGVDFPILPRVRLDLCADQHSQDLTGFTEANGDTITFAAVLRLRL
jgi:hypothetical protein